MKSTSYSSRLLPPTPLPELRHSYTTHSSDSGMVEQKYPLDLGIHSRSCTTLRPCHAHSHDGGVMRPVLVKFSQLAVQRLLAHGRLLVKGRFSQRSEGSAARRGGRSLRTKYHKHTMIGSSRTSYPLKCSNKSWNTLPDVLLGRNKSVTYREKYDCSRFFCNNQ